jgi:hypothetical protein
MKKFALGILAMGLLPGFSAQAIFLPGWERPRYQAHLKETDEAGHELRTLGKVTLTLNRQDGAQQDTSFTLVEKIQTECLIGPCPIETVTRQFHIDSAKAVGFGLFHYTATENRTEDPQNAASLAVDQDGNRSTWNVQLTAANGDVRYFEGEFGAVLTIQNSLALAIRRPTAQVPAVHCTAKIKVDGETKNLLVDGNRQDNTLDISIFPLEESNPQPFETMSYDVTRVIPMFPIYSIDAEKNLQPVDGADTKVALNINTESVSVTGGAHQATLQIDSTSLRGDTESNRYSLSCHLNER